MRRNKLLIKVKSSISYALTILLGFVFLLIFAYLSQAKFSQAPSPLPVVPTASPASPTSQADLAQPMPVSAITDYKTILLLEHAADMLVAYEDKVKSGEIDPQDADTRQQYTLVFPVAIDSYNQTLPTTGMESSWRNVVRVTTAYAAVYPLLQQGKQVSTNDLFHMQSYRQLLINYRSDLEGLLARKGMDPEDLTAVQGEVSSLIQETYGSTPMPPAVP